MTQVSNDYEIKRAVNYYKMKEGETRYVIKTKYNNYKWVSYNEAKRVGGWKIKKTKYGPEINKFGGLAKSDTLIGDEICGIKNNNGETVGKIKGGIKHTKNIIGDQIEVGGEVVGYEKKWSDNNKISLHKAKVGVKGQIGGIVEAKYNVVEGQHGGLGYNVGVGVGTGAGIVDDSAKVKVLGFGLTVGRKVGFSTPFGGISFDFGKM